eukprot:6195089-Pleurochrysis_carterae.AAC.1
MLARTRAHQHAHWRAHAHAHAHLVGDAEVPPVCLERGGNFVGVAAEQRRRLARERHQRRRLAVRLVEVVLERDELLRRGANLRAHAHAHARACAC